MPGFHWTHSGAPPPCPRAPAPKRTARHSGHAFRKLQAQPQSRFVVHNRPKLTTARCAGHCRAWSASMPGFRETPCAPRVVTVHHRPSPINQRGHVVRPPCPSFASSVTGQGRHATSPLSVHQVHGHGPPAPLPCAALGRYTLPLLPHQPSSVHQRLAREGVRQVDAARHCGTVRTRKPPQAPVCSPASTTEPLSGSQRPQAHHRALRQALPR